MSSDSTTPPVRLAPSTPVVEGVEEILTERALELVALLHERFAARRDDLLAARTARRDAVAAGKPLDFLPETAHIRADSGWRVPPAPQALLDRKVEITGPTDPKMAINALNSGAKVWMADLEDANTPHWRNVITGHRVLRDAALGTLAHEEAGGKRYALRTDAPLAVIAARPRGWHYDERHLEVGDRSTVAALVDIALHAVHTWTVSFGKGLGPFYYLPKMESHHEAALWAEIFALLESEIGIPAGSVRATALIETLPAAFEMEEFLHALGPYAAGLNAGRWDYIFSTIKTLRDSGTAYVLPDRTEVTMEVPFMRAYAELLVATCHRRGAHAIGGMSAFIPSRRDAEVNAVAMAKVRADKEREAAAGFDGAWIAHPDLMPVCLAAFDSVLGDRLNQLERVPDVRASAADLLDVASAPGGATLAGLRANISAALEYLTEWLQGKGAVAINSMMEDAATAEISRSQVWQWLRYATPLDGGAPITRGLVESILEEEAQRLCALETVGDAKRVLAEAVLAEDFPDFLTLLAYPLIRE